MYEYACELIRVVDGDTVDVRIDLGFSIFVERRVRLYGINAPEPKGVTVDAGRAATTALWGALSKQIIRVHTLLDDRDKYGRVLGTFFVGDVNINLLMIKNGHAVEYLLK